MKLLYLLVMISISFGCVSVNKDTYSSVIGLTVSEAIEQLNIETKNEYFYITEPPAVPRGISGKLPNGKVVRLFIKRGQIPLIFGDADIDIFLNLSVIGIAVGSDICHGEVMWHFTCS